ncbi:MAG: hypothetical protein ABJM29_18910 [Rhizobiaceae bacterium]
MCTDETRQEILFLLAFRKANKPLEMNSITAAMQSSIAEMSWSKHLVHSPKTSPKILKRAVKFGHINKVSPFEWDKTPKGMDRLSYLVDHYLPNDQKNDVKRLELQAA